MNINGDNLSGRVVRGLSASAYGQVVTLLVQIAGVPILLHYWGAQLFGEWLIVFAIPSYLAVTDLGFSQSAGNDMTARVARGDRAGALRVFQSLTALLCVASSVVVVTSAVALTLLPVGRWMHLTLLSSGAVEWILWLLVSEMLMKLVGGAVHAGLRSNGQNALHLTTYYTTLLMQQVAIWVVAALGYGPLAAAAAFAGVRWCAVPSLAIFMFRRHRWLKVGFRHSSIRELRQLVAPSLANMSMPLSQAINVQGMVLVVGAMFGPVAVVVFSALRTLSRFPLSLAQGVSTAIEPELAAAWGTEDRPLVRTLFLRESNASFWAGVALGTILFAAGRWIIELWTHGKVQMNETLYGWLLLAAMLGVLWNTSLMLLKSVNLHLGASLWYVFSSLASVGLGVLLIRLTGRLADAGLALAVTNAGMSAYLLRAAGKLTELTTFRLVTRVLSPVLLAKSVRAGFSHVR